MEELDVSAAKTGDCSTRKKSLNVKKLPVHHLSLSWHETEQGMKMILICYSFMKQLKDDDNNFDLIIWRCLSRLHMWGGGGVGFLPNPLIRWLTPHATDIINQKIS